jgi:tetratricopeptide (TPR) repeat protein
MFFSVVRPTELSRRNVLKSKMVDHFPKVRHMLTAGIAELLDPTELTRACSVSKGWKAQLTHVLIAKCNSEIKQHESLVSSRRTNHKEGPSKGAHEEFHIEDEGPRETVQLGIAAAYFKRAMVNEVGGKYAEAFNDFEHASLLSAPRAGQASIHSMATFHQAKCLAAARQGAACQAAGISWQGGDLETPLAVGSSRIVVLSSEEEDELLRQALLSDPAFPAAALVLSSNYSRKYRHEDAEVVLDGAIRALHQCHCAHRDEQRRVTWERGHQRGVDDATIPAAANAASAQLTTSTSGVPANTAHAPTASAHLLSTNGAKGVASLASLYFALGVLLETGVAPRTLEAVKAFSKAMEYDRTLTTAVVRRRSMLYVLPAVPVVLPVLVAWKAVRYSPWAAWQLLAGAGRVTIATHRHVIAPTASFVGSTMATGVLATRDYVVLPAVNAITYTACTTASILEVGMVFTADTMMNYLLLPARDFVLVPLKDGTVYLARSAAWAVANTAAAARDYIVVPLKDSIVFIARTAVHAITAIATATHDFAIAPLANASFALARAATTVIATTALAGHGYILVPAVRLVKGASVLLTRVVTTIAITTATTIRDYMLVPLKDAAAVAARSCGWAIYHILCRPLYWVGFYGVHYLSISGKFLYRAGSFFVCTLAKTACAAANAVATTSRAAAIAAANLVWSALLQPMLQLGYALSTFVWSSLVLPVWHVLHRLAAAIAVGASTVAGAVAAAAFAAWTPVAAAAMAMWTSITALAIAIGTTIAAAASAAAASAVAAGASASAVVSMMGSALYSVANSVWAAVGSLFSAVL